MAIQTVFAVHGEWIKVTQYHLSSLHASGISTTDYGSLKLTTDAYKINSTLSNHILIVPKLHVR